MKWLLVALHVMSGADGSAFASFAIVDGLYPTKRACEAKADQAGMPKNFPASMIVYSEAKCVGVRAR